MLIISLIAFKSKVIVHFPGIDEDFLLKCFYVLFFAVIGFDIYLRFFEDPAIRFARIYGENKNFLSRLSTLERKRWIVQEMFNRKEYGL